MQRQTSALQRNKAFYAGVGSLPVNSRVRTHGRTDGRTDNYNFSITSEDVGHLGASLSERFIALIALSRVYSVGV